MTAEDLQRTALTDRHEQAGNVELRRGGVVE